MLSFQCACDNILNLFNNFLISVGTRFYLPYTMHVNVVVCIYLVCRNFALKLHCKTPSNEHRLRNYWKRFAHYVIVLWWAHIICDIIGYGEACEGLGNVSHTRPTLPARHCQVKHHVSIRVIVWLSCDSHVTTGDISKSIIPRYQLMKRSWTALVRKSQTQVSMETTANI